LSDPLSKFEEWAHAQQAALAAEQRLVQLASEGVTPTITDLQHALILRSKASALLMAVASARRGPVADSAPIRFTDKWLPTNALPPDGRAPGSDKPRHEPDGAA